VALHISPDEARVERGSDDPGVAITPRILECKDDVALLACGSVFLLYSDISERGDEREKTHHFALVVQLFGS
jgi:hypothetical protein